MNKFNEIYTALYYIEYHAKQSGVQYRSPDKFSKIKELIEKTKELEDMIDTVNGIRGFRFKDQT